MFSIKIKHDFSNGPRRLPKNPPNFIILDNWAFENFILGDESSAKALRIYLVYCLTIICVEN